MQPLDQFATPILGVLGDYSLNGILLVTAYMVVVASIVLLITKVATFSRINNMLLEIYQGQLDFRAQAIFLIFVVYKLYIYLDIFVDSDFTMAFSFVSLSAVLKEWLKNVSVKVRWFFIYVQSNSLRKSVFTVV